MIGEKFNKLLVLEECKERSHDGHKRYKCICDCGNITYVDGRCLRSNIYLTYNGKTQTIKQWAEELNINYAPLYYRYNLGWNTKGTLFGRDV